MAFTHDRPSGQRHYPIAYSTASAPVTAGTFSRGETSFSTADTSRTTNDGETWVSTYSDEGTLLSVDSSSNSNYFTSNSNGARLENSSAVGSTYANYSFGEALASSTQVLLLTFQSSVGDLLRSTSSTRSRFESKKELFESSSYNSVWQL